MQPLCFLCEKHLEALILVCELRAELYTLFFISADLLLTELLSMYLENYLSRPTNTKTRL